MYDIYVQTWMALEEYLATVASVDRISSPMLWVRPSMQVWLVWD